MCLPFPDQAVVGNSYYATPIPATPLRLRIDFTRTIHADTYGGLRLAVVDRDRGEIDAVAGFVHELRQQLFATSGGMRNRTAQGAGVGIGVAFGAGARRLFAFIPSGCR